MGTVETEIDLRVDELADETIAAARRTVAQHATDAADLAELLDMLGLRGDPEVMCKECGESLSSPEPFGYRAAGAGGGLCSKCRPKADRRKTQKRCKHGHLTPVDSESCAECQTMVDIEDVRALVERIKRDTGDSTSAIAKAAGLHPPTLTSALVPSSRNKRMSRSAYVALKRLAEELSA